MSDLEEKVIRTHRDIAHMILPNFEPNQIVETVDKSDKEKLDWDDYEEIVEMVSNIKELTIVERIMLIVNLLKTTQEKINLLQDIIEVVEQTLRKEFPRCKVYPYGSTSSGFAFQDCDLDIFIDLGLLSLDEIGVKHNDLIDRTIQIADMLHREERFRSATPVAGARTPIVKFKDRRTVIQCHVNVCHAMGSS